MIQVNLKNNAITETTENFNSMCRFGTKLIGVSSTGLYEIGGTSDNGTAINASIKSGDFDLGTNQKKKFRFFYFGVKTTGTLRLKVYCDGVLAASYIAKPESSGDRTIRVPVSREHVGRYWAWSIENIDGAPFSLYSVQAIPVIMHPNRGQ